MSNFFNIRVCFSDVVKMREEVKEIYLDHHPEMEGANITDAHLFAQMVKFYVEG